MINIIVDGYKLDLYPVNLSYKRTNNAFTFGKLTLNRTQSFKLPKTSKNMKVLGVGSALIFGDSERRYFNAQLQGSGFAENGLLYVDSVEADFTCIFIYGNLIKLKSISQEKDMKSFLEPFDVYLYLSRFRSAKNANASDLQIYDNVKYRNNQENGANYLYTLPSVSVRDIIVCANQTYGNIFDLSVVPDYRIVLPTLKEASRNNITFAKVDVNTFSGEQNLKLLFEEVSTTYAICTDGRINSYETPTIKRYRTKQDTEIKIPLDFAEDIFILQDNSYFTGTTGTVVIDVEFFGGYEFDIAERAVNSLSEEGVRNTTGIPLAGRTITIPAGKQFSFYRKNDFHNTRSVGTTQINNYRGFFTGDASPFIYAMPEVSLKNKAQWNTVNTITVYMLDNLPKISIINLYNSIAILQGKYMTYADNVITMVDYSGFTDSVIIKHPTDTSELLRTGLTEARKNVIKFEGSDIVRPANVITIDYATDNELLEEEAVIYTYPFSEGEAYTDNNNLYLNNITLGEPNNNNEQGVDVKNEVPVIAEAGLGEFLERVEPTKINLLTQIYEKSTKITLSCVMTLYEFMAIKENNFIIYKNQKWVWISGNWQKNKAKFVIQKV